MTKQQLVDNPYVLVLFVEMHRIRLVHVDEYLLSDVDPTCRQDYHVYQIQDYTDIHVIVNHRLPYVLVEYI